MPDLTTNLLYFGDNLTVLREKIPSESVDLIYIDPPFNSARNYFVTMKDRGGEASKAQEEAFADTWHWGPESDRAYRELISQTPNHELAVAVRALRDILKETPMLAYLVSMAQRVAEMHRTLKPTGNFYLHCDPTASHYLKILLDCIFGPENFKNEVIWKRVNAKGNVQQKFGAVHDTLLYYTKNRGMETWNQPYRPLRDEYIAETYRYLDSNGRKYRLDNLTASMQRASKGQIYEWKGKTPPPSRCWVYAKERMEELDAQGRIYYSKTGYPSYIRYLEGVMNLRC